MIFAIAVALAGSALAFPAAVLEGLNTRTAKAAGCPSAEAAKLKRQAPPDVVFDPIKQKVDVSGRYAFVPPKAGDQRGPCPGLNALANHGYLPHNGVTSLAQAIEATNKGFGMGLDLGTALSASTLRNAPAVIDGNPATLQWSI
ncbi:hypothetical protein FRC09_017818, partial [Ceratobasidium sp. 395]